jgi:hypothetical protein
MERDESADVERPSGPRTLRPTKPSAASLSVGPLSVARRSLPRCTELVIRRASRSLENGTSVLRPGSAIPVGRKPDRGSSEATESGVYWPGCGDEDRQTASITELKREDVHLGEPTNLRR